MAIIKKGSTSFEPYARIMTIIGDQLITDKKVAVIEIVKNSYDADAENVKVNFSNQSNHGSTWLPLDEQPYIEIIDDGDGMSLDTILDVWLKPATPVKFEKKKRAKTTTPKGRTIQGEKGVGRFAIHKLGDYIELYTKTKFSDEVKLTLDFADYDPEKADLFNSQPTHYKLLNEVTNDWIVNDTPQCIKGIQGTCIKIYKLRENWIESDFEALYKAFNRLVPPNDPHSLKFDIEISQDFNIGLYIDKNRQSFDKIITVNDVIERAPFSIMGVVSDDGVLRYTYECVTTHRKKANQSLDLMDPDKLANENYDFWAINEYFHKRNRSKPKCGEIKFSLYAYDLSSPDKVSDTKALKEVLKDNFIYVYRDGVRVYPYGEQGYDWLNLDKLRSSVRAGWFMSYNDLVGFIYISQEGNKLLKDATNRQNIVNVDGAYDDFTGLVTAITELFNAETRIDKEKVKIVKSKSIRDLDLRLDGAYQELTKNLTRIDDSDTLKSANKFLKEAKNFASQMKDRVHIVEDLAGLGMAVEKSSHDTLMLLGRMMENIQDFRLRARNQGLNSIDVDEFCNIMEGNLQVIYDSLQIIQPLFKFKRQSIREIKLAETIEKVLKYFKRDLNDNIQVEIIGDKDFVLSTNEGLIMQMLINLIDNAIYWLNKLHSKDRKILFSLNAADQTLIIADNGPGIKDEIIPVIFNEFFSQKAEGRGLGLYIVSEILMRIGAEIAVIERDKEMMLSGANFIVKFKSE